MYDSQGHTSHAANDGINLIVVWFRWRQLSQQLQLKGQECELCEDKLRQTTHHRQLEDVNKLEAETGTYLYIALHWRFLFTRFTADNWKIAW